MRILIFGLGLHGGGVSAAAYFASHGHEVRVTDLQDAGKLSSSLLALRDHQNISYILGTHREEDITWADIIIKNPAVPSTLPLLSGARYITNDIGYFLDHSTLPVIGITGSKGKSTTTALVSHILESTSGHICRGGNIGRSPLDFLDDIDSYDESVLELSSWQLHDLSRNPFRGFRDVIITPLYHDHQNRYESYEDYLQDKFSIFTGTDPIRYVILPLQKELENISCDAESIWSYRIGKLPEACRNGVSILDGILSFRRDGNLIEEVPYPHDHSYLPAITYCFASGLDPDVVIYEVSHYEPLPHRREVVISSDKVTCINDTAATIPDAVIFSLSQITEPVHLITGGTDKALDPQIAVMAMKGCRSVHLLSGSYTDKLIPCLEASGISYSGPFDKMKDAVDSAAHMIDQAEVILLSPGASSFEHFLHEFDRGDQFRDHCMELFSR